MNMHTEHWGGAGGVGEGGGTCVPAGPGMLIRYSLRLNIRRRFEERLKAR